MQTSGNVTADAYAGGVALKANYIEDVFVTWLSTGTGTTRTVTGPDMTTGGLSITKSRSAATGWHFVDTVRGAGNSLSSNTTAANASESTGVTAFTSTGTSIGAAAEYNTSGATYVDYLIKKQPKFFDVVTYTGTNSSVNIAHNLGCQPGALIVKRTDGTGQWFVFVRDGTSGSNFTYSEFISTGALNNTAAADGTGFGLQSLGRITPTTFNPYNLSSTNAGGITDMDISGATYVAYLFAHNAGGFGATGTDNVISCGSYTGTGAIGNTITVGYEPQWVMIKASSGTSAASQDWYIYDVMRGMPVGDAINDNRLMANLSSAEASYPEIGPTATGFVCEATGARLNESGTTYIYIAIRRGPMKVPTDATKVFTPVSTTPNANNYPVSTGNLVDMLWSQALTSVGGDNESYAFDRLRGSSVSSQPFLKLSSTGAETTQAGQGIGISQNTGYIDNWFYWNYGVGRAIGNWAFSRAPSFFDEVCYTGTGSGTVITHNLGVAPELIITKKRSGSSNWGAFHSFTPTQNMYNYLDSAGAGFNAAYGTASRAFQSQPTSSQYVTGGQDQIDTSGQTYVNYLFATCPGVSKVGSYTGNGTTQTINCGFTGGARFVLIKRTDATGDWYVYDTARGMTTLTDPYLLLNTQSSQVATLGSVTTVTTGFALNSAITAAINVNAGTYIFLAIA